MATDRPWTDPEYGQWYLDALREVDALCPGSDPVAPPPLTPWQLEQMRGMQNAAASLGHQASLAHAAQQALWNPQTQMLGERPIEESLLHGNSVWRSN